MISGNEECGCSYQKIPKNVSLVVCLILLLTGCAFAPHYAFDEIDVSVLFYHDGTCDIRIGKTTFKKEDNVYSEFIQNGHTIHRNCNQIPVDRGYTISSDYQVLLTMSKKTKDNFDTGEDSSLVITFDGIKDEDEYIPDYFFYIDLPKRMGRACLMQAVAMGFDEATLTLNKSKYKPYDELVGTGKRHCHL